MKSLMNDTEDKLRLRVGIDVLIYRDLIFLIKLFECQFWAELLSFKVSLAAQSGH